MVQLLRRDINLRGGLKMLTDVSVLGSSRPSVRSHLRENGIVGLGEAELARPDLAAAGPGWRPTRESLGDRATESAPTTKKRKGSARSSLP